MLELEGEQSALLPFLQHEAGGHRWQRVPPTERKGRTQSSTVTVAVLPIPEPQDYRLDARDLDEFVTRGSGPGGQHKNKTDSCVTIRHRPTGIQCRADMRSQHESRRIARETLEARVAEHYAGQETGNRNASRRAQVGSGERSDKVRTYREQDDRVTDHRNSKSCRLKAVRQGDLAKLW